MIAVAGIEEEMIARVGRENALRRGDVTGIAADTAAMHLFDHTTTRAIYTPP